MESAEDRSNAVPLWRVIAHRKQQQRERSIRPEWRLNCDRLRGLANLMHIPIECGILTAEEIEITSDNDAVDIVEKIRDGLYTVQQVITAFCKRAAIAHQLTNCLTEIFFEQAVTRAQEMDAHRRENPTEALPPLFGLPISLKDSFHLSGMDTTVGFVSLVDKPSTFTGTLPSMLMSLGAVLYCKTNVPQTMMTADSDNNVFGRTLNPRNTSLTAGGSSGGEGALVAMRGSVLGVGTDIAGSIRIPALCCGTYGFKPSSCIVPYAGQQSPATPGIPGILPVAGPLATSARACHMFMKAVMEAKPWEEDPFSHRIPWVKESLPRRKLCIGLVKDDGDVTPSPPMQRAVRESVEKLQRAGHDIVPINFEDVGRIINDCWQMFGIDGMAGSKAFVDASGEPLVTSVVGIGLPKYTPKNLQDFMALNARRMATQARYFRIWKTYHLDLIIAPSAAHTACPLDKYVNVNYTALFNYLDWPAAVIPVGEVSIDDTVGGAAKYGKHDQDLYSMYTGPNRYAHAPTSVQMIGRPQEDEKLAALMVVVDHALRQGS